MGRSLGRHFVIQLAGTREGLKLANDQGTHYWALTGARFAEQIKELAKIPSKEDAYRETYQGTVLTLLTQYAGFWAINMSRKWGHLVQLLGGDR